ncbi:MAG TPA: DUF305 domain-containing protein, partial [Bryobacteraceae bacterium]
MAFRFWVIFTPLLLLRPSPMPGQENRTASGSAPIVQPGAPGHNGKVLSPENARVPSRGPTEADTSFMQGMIMHHSQAVEMTDLMAARTHNPELLSLGKRISISQTDEMKYMKQWLEDRGKPTTMEHHMDHMA